MRNFKEYSKKFPFIHLVRYRSKDRKIKHLSTNHEVGASAFSFHERGVFIRGMNGTFPIGVPFRVPFSKIHHQIHSKMGV